MTFGCNSFKAWANLSVALVCFLTGLLLCLSIHLLPTGYPWTGLNILGPAALGIPGAILMVLSVVPFLMFFHKMNLTSTKQIGIAWRKQSIKELILIHWERRSRSSLEDHQKLMPSTYHEDPQTELVQKTENYDEVVSIPEEMPANVDDFVRAFHLDSPSQAFFPTFK